VAGQAVAGKAIQGKPTTGKAQRKAQSETSINRKRENEQKRLPFCAKSFIIETS
jgi:hypothetical protein